MSFCLISLGQVVDAFSLKVNGQTVAIGQISVKADLGSSLQVDVNKMKFQ
ncbi:hypothetical protein PQG22_01530 [Aquirufa beregesia]